MRTFKEFVVDIMKKPPVLFPLVGLFHVLWLVWTIRDDRHEAFPNIVWLQILWLSAYTFLWILACDMRKQAAIGYIALTIIDLFLYLAARNHLLSEMYVSNIFIIDVLFSLALLYYYKLFR